MSFRLFPLLGVAFIAAGAYSAIISPIISPGAAQENVLYLQGGFGFGLIDDHEQDQGGTMTVISTDEVPPVVGVEAGLDRLGSSDKIRAGVSYQTFNMGFSDPGSNGTIRDAQIHLVSANTYYHLGDIITVGSKVEPYIGAGLVWMMPEDFEGELTYALHAGAEIPYTRRISLGTQYSYLFGTDFSDEDDLTVTTEDTHLLSATLTYKFMGGMEPQQAMQARSLAPPNAGLRPQSNMNQSSMNQSYMTNMGNTQAGGTRGYGQARYQRNY